MFSDRKIGLALGGAIMNSVPADICRDHDLNFSNWKDTLSFYSENKMREFYLKGKKETCAP